MSNHSSKLIALYVRFGRIMSMEKKQKLGDKVNSYVYNHLWLKYTLDYGKAFLLTALSALFFSFAFLLELRLCQ